MQHTYFKILHFKWGIKVLKDHFVLVTRNQVISEWPSANKIRKIMQ